MNGFIAIDGGGSKTELVLVSEKGKIYYHSIVSCTNPNDIGINKSVKVLTSVINEAMDKAVKEDINVKCVMLAIAGVEFGDISAVLKTKLQKNLNFDNLFVSGDLASVIELHLSNQNKGIVIISGTGFNMAFKQNEAISTVGGWGYMPDNYLSGFDLGKDALIASSRAIDGVGENTILVSMLEKHFKNKLWYAMDEIYKNGIKKVASLSRFVAKGYLENDLVCKNIIDERIKRLSEVIKNKTNHEGNSVFLCGGIFENNPFIVDKLKDCLGDEYTLQVTNNKTIYGAARLAIKKMKNNVDETFLHCFDKSYKEVTR